MNHCIIFGNFSDGYTIVGPFATRKDALTYINEAGLRNEDDWMEDCMIIPIHARHPRDLEASANGQTANAECAGRHFSQPA